MKKRIVLIVVLAALCMATCSGYASQNVLLELSGGRQVDYEPYRLYLEVAGEISRYSTRQAVVFTMAMESYLKANSVILSEEECLSLCEQEMNEHLQSEAFKRCSDILTEHYGMEDEEIMRCVWENYWSQYVARMLSGFYHAQEEMTGTLAEKMFNDFTKQFYANLSFEEDSLGVFAGEAIAWTPIYENLCTYNEINALLEVAGTIALNSSVEEFLEERNVTVDLTGMEESVKEAVSAMRANTLYSSVFDSILENRGKTMEDFLTAMKPFVLANYQRAAFGQECYGSYQAMEDDGNKPTMEEYYYKKLDEVSQTYVVHYLGW